MLQRTQTMWGWLQRHWVAVLLPPAAFCLAAGVTGQMRRVWKGTQGSRWMEEYRAAGLAETRRDRSAAVAHLRRAVQAAPDQKEAHLQLAAAYAGMGLNGPAAERLERAVCLAPAAEARRESFLSVVSQYCDLGRFDDAERVLRDRVWPRWPDSPDSLYLHGLIVLHRERGEPGLRRASALLKACLRADPRHTRARFYYAAAQAQLGNLQEASQAYRRVVRESPTTAGARYDLAAVLRRAGKPAEADRVLADMRRIQARQRRILKLTEADAAPLGAEELLELGSSYLEFGQPDLALDPLVLLTRKEPADPRGHRLLSEAYRRLKQPDNARVERQLAAALPARTGRP